ncbi:MAG: DUF4924 family protein [Bacteroidaceae bacterium]|nr:DUF4924 family protein [Bacteroidaceae bacterium]
MYISRELKDKNIAEYLLYMWQVEDIIRGCGLDMDVLEREYLSKFNVGDEGMAELRQWYSVLMEMMRSEGVEKKGHLQINRNIVILMTDLHVQLLNSSKHPYYSAAYYKALPFIVELRSRGDDKDIPEVENCLNAMYGLMMLRLQGKPVSDDTKRAMDDIAKLLGMLSEYYKKDKQGEVEF